MHRVVSGLLISLALLLPSVAPAVAAAPQDSSAASTDVAAYPHADHNGNRISDGLDAILESAGPADHFDVVATFENEAAAGKSERYLPEQALNRRLQLVSGFSASLNRGQINALSHQPGVVRVEENFAVIATNNATNADFGTAAARIDYGVDGSGVGICIPDTGYDSDHEQLDDAGKLAGWFDAVGGGTTPYDDQGHGTHVAGTAAGSGTGGTNAATYRGVAPAATIYATKVLNSSGTSVADSVEQGIAWCVEQPGVDVISMSLGTTAGSDGLDVLSQAVNAAVDAGKIVVVAAGNAGDAPGTVGSPGAAEKAITVGAVAEWSAPTGAANHSSGIYLAPFSSRGPTLGDSPLVKPDIASPGVTVASASAGSTSGYATGSGTSMATPFTAGTIALMLQADPSLTYADISNLLASTAQDHGPAGKDNQWGWGLIDGLALVAEASGAGLYQPTAFPANTTLTGSVEPGGVWSHTFTVGPDDLNVPIAATVLIDLVESCLFPIGSGCLIWGLGPDLEARLIGPSGAELDLSECPARPAGECGSLGQQELINVVPLAVGEYVIEVFPVADGGTFTVDLSLGAPVAWDVAAPVVVVSSPEWGSMVARPALIAGSATDDVGVAAVLLNIYDYGTSRWWNGAGWQDAYTSFDAVLDVGTTSRAWSYGFDPGTLVGQQPYWVRAIGFDEAGNPSADATVNFSMSSDVAAPVVVVSSPEWGSTVARPALIAGSATDDVGVAAVLLNIYDYGTSRWWNGAGWQDAYTSFDAVLDVGTTSRAWSYGFDPGTLVGQQPYWVRAIGFDEAGNPSADATVNFSMSSDVAAPVVVVSSPEWGSTVARPALIAGSATDDVGVAAVLLNIYDYGTSRWWNGAGWQDAYTSFDAVLDVGTTSRAWSYGFDPGTLVGQQPYWVRAIGFDEAGNPSADATVNFSMSAP